MTWQKNSTSNLELRTVCPPESSLSSSSSWASPLLIFHITSLQAYVTTGVPVYFYLLCVTPSKFSSPSLLTVTYVIVNFTFLLCLFVAVNCCYDDSWYTSCVREVPQLLHMSVSCKVNLLLVYSAIYSAALADAIPVLTVALLIRCCALPSVVQSVTLQQNAWGGCLSSWQPCDMVSLLLKNIIVNEKRFMYYYHY